MLFYLGFYISIYKKYVKVKNTSILTYFVIGDHNIYGGSPSVHFFPKFKWLK